MVECNIGKISKTHSPRCRKNTFSEVFQIKLFAINIKWTKWSQHQLIDRSWLCYKCLCAYLVNTHNQLISQNLT